MDFLDKFEEIISGWKNYAFPNPQVEKIAKERLKICLGCDKLTSTYMCPLCHCFMPAKVRSVKSKCRINKW